MRVAATALRGAFLCGAGPLETPNAVAPRGTDVRPVAGLGDVAEASAAAAVSAAAAAADASAAPPAVVAEEERVAADLAADAATADEAAAKAARGFLARVQQRKETRWQEASRHAELAALVAADASKALDTNSSPAVVPESLRVRFDLGASTVHEVTPYSEIYGLHPREFVFGRGFYMMPAAGPYGFTDIGAAAAQQAGIREEEDEEEDTDDDSDNDWVSDSDADEPRCSHAGSLAEQATGRVADAVKEGAASSDSTDVHMHRI